VNNFLVIVSRRVSERSMRVPPDVPRNFRQRLHSARFVRSWVPVVKTSKSIFRRAAHPFAAFLFACVAFIGSAEASSRWATLEAIHKLENPKNSPRPGRHGELGAYQFRSTTWRMHTGIPFQEALDRGTSDAVAVKHYEWLKRGLESAQVPATPYNIALAWNGGLSAVIAGKSPSQAHDYARRAANLAAAFDRPTKVQLVADAGSAMGGSGQ
jgi:hypothetical protein